MFSDDAKKDQFPDAFIFEALRAISNESEPLTIVSDDKDFAAAIKDGQHITRLKSIPDLFAELGLMIERREKSKISSTIAGRSFATVDDD